MVKSKVEQDIIDALEARAAEHGIDIVDVEVVGATKAPCVRVRLDKLEGDPINLDEVTAQTAWVSETVEALDPISSAYTLEVSSPGMKRPLRRPSDFARFVGEDVELKSIAREPGQRSKVAVHSLDDRLDPVGACVGPKGSRVRAVVGELRGERVDVILWDEDPAVYVANALSPAKVTRVLIDPEKNYAGVIVPDDQLSLAIGKEGQNARLAARLTGWHIDIKSETLAADILKNVPLAPQPVVEDLIDDEPADLQPERCAHVGEDGTRCRNQARPGSRFCGVHDGELDGAGDDALACAEDLI